MLHQGLDDKQAEGQSFTVCVTNIWKVFLQDVQDWKYYIGLRETLTSFSDRNSSGIFNVAAHFYLTKDLIVIC